ncbi:hypothetical protein KC850_02790 [Candidatus Kaiserbacteria bacterium]|nr:hypothetical protein [Candidatus Kaiserbacteria bacterium]
MPMIDVEWDPYEYSVGQMTALCKDMEDDLRASIKHARPSVDHEYKVLIRGRPHPPIALNVPMLEIRVEYHQEWEFTQEELDKIATEMQRRIEYTLNEFKILVEDGKIRFYARMGYKGVDLQTD